NIENWPSKLVRSYSIAGPKASHISLRTEGPLIHFSIIGGYPLHSMAATTIGVIGCGYWGPNLLPNFAENDTAQLRWIFDTDERRLAAMCSRYSGARRTTDVSELIGDGELDAIAVVTPVATHFQIAKDALSAGKHVLVEKPLTSTVREAEELIELAEKQGRTL